MSGQNSVFGPRDWWNMNINGSDLEVHASLPQLPVHSSSWRSLAVQRSWHLVDMQTLTFDLSDQSFQPGTSRCLFPFVFCSRDTPSDSNHLYPYSLVICTRGNIFIVTYYVLSVSWSFPRPDGSDSVTLYITAYCCGCIFVFFNSVRQRGKNQLKQLAL